MCPVLMDRGLFFSSRVSGDNIFSSTRPKPQARPRRQKITCLPLKWGRRLWDGFDGTPSPIGARPSHRQDPVFLAWHGPGSPRSRQLSAVADPEGLLTMPCRRVLVPGDPRSRWETCSRGERGGKSWMDRLPGLIKCPTRVLCPAQDCRGPRCLGRGKLPLPGSRTQQHLHPGKNMNCHRLAAIDLQPVIDGSGRCQCLVAVPRCDSHLSQQHAGAFAFIMLCARLVPAPEPLHLDEA